MSDNESNDTDATLHEHHTFTDSFSLNEPSSADDNEDTSVNRLSTPSRPKQISSTPVRRAILKTPTNNASKKEKADTTNHNQWQTQQQKQRKIQQHQSAKKLVIYGRNKNNQSPGYVQHNKPVDNSKPNRTCTGLFVTRLPERYSAWQLEKCVWLNSGYNVKAEKLNTRYDTYTSFYIPADRQLRDALMDPDIWPVKSMVRLFFN